MEAELAEDPAGRHQPGFSIREIATYSSTLFGLLCLIKVYGVARYSTTTTAMLVTTAPERIILGTLAIYVYPTMTALTYGIPWFAVVWRGRIHREAWPLLLAVVVVTGLMTPPSYHLTGIVVVAVSGLIELVLRREATARGCSRLRIPAALLHGSHGHALLYVGGLSLLLGFLQTLESPWTSPEVYFLRASVVTTTQQPDDPRAAGHHLEVVSTGGPVIGFLVDESLTDYTILNARTRFVMTLEKRIVVNRYPCHEKDTQLRGQAPLLSRLQGQRYNTPNSDCDEVVAQLARLPENASPGERAP